MVPNNHGSSKNICVRFMYYYFDNIVKESLLVIAIICAPTVLACSFIGLLVSIVQSATQVQEQSISFLCKLITVVLVILIFGEWGGRHLAKFFIKIIDQIPYVST